MAEYDKAALIRAALKARKNAYAPYSRFYVGAALLTESGRIFTGANVENSSFPVGICAERSAFAAAVSSGERKFTAICVAGGSENDPHSGSSFIMPCGMCRQFMTEFCDKDFEIISVSSEEDYTVNRLDTLMPNAFLLSGSES